MLHAAYTTLELAARDTHALIELVAVAIAVEAFVLFTAVTLREKKIVVYTPYHLHPVPRLLALLSFINGALATVFAFSGLLTREFFIGPRRPRDPLRRLALLGVSRQASTRLSHPALFLPRRDKLSPSAISHPRTGLSRLAKVYSYLRNPLVTSQVQPPTCVNRCGSSSHSDTTAPYLLAAPSPMMDCTTPTLVNKGFQYLTNVSLARTYQQPPFLGHNYGP